MRLLTPCLLAGGLLAAVSIVAAQPPGRPGRPGGSNSTSASFVNRMLTLDANHDGKLSKVEVTDSRLTALFERADANHDDTVTKNELSALYSKESTTLARGFGGPGGGPEGAGGPGGPNARRGGGPPGGRPPLGQILPPPVQDALQLTDAQRQKLQELQQQVDASLAKILTDEQKQMLEQMRAAGPPGFGPPGGPGGGFPPGGDQFPRP